jgi:hypothetical protein
MIKAKQGQTLYYVDPQLQKGKYAKPVVRSYFIHSQKTELPPEYCVIERMPVTLANELIDLGNQFFLSRRKAESHRAMTERYWMIYWKPIKTN